MSEWIEYKLGELCEKIDYGYTASAQLEPVGPKFLRITDIVPQRINWKDVPYCKINDIEYKKNKLEKGDIVIARTGATTGYNYMFDDDEDTVFASYLIRYRVDKGKAYPKFIKYTLKSEYWKSFVEGIIGGSAQPGANAKQFASFEILLPPLPEQKAIASVLGSLDDKIDLLHRQNKTLEVIVETLFRQWFIEEADKSWSDGYLPDEFDFTMGSSPPGESYNEEGIGIPMYQGNADFEIRFPKRRVFTTEPKRFAEKYDTLISVRAPVGEQNMANEKCCIGRGVAALRYKNDNSFYTYTYFKIKSIMEEIKQFNETGTVFGSISKGDFESLALSIPSKALVKKFQIEVKPVDDKIITNTFQIRKLEKLRDTLLPKLMSGEVRVRN